MIIVCPCVSCKTVYVPAMASKYREEMLTVATPIFFMNKINVWLAVKPVGLPKFTLIGVVGSLNWND